MKIYKTLGTILLCMLFVSGCVSNDSANKQPYSGETNLAGEYIAKGESLEKKGFLTRALEQYKLALTIDPENRKAAELKKDILPKLWEKAQFHYKKGLEFDKQGKYELARREYLSALVNWPDYEDAKKKLTPGQVSESNAYIIHKLMKGESVSKLGMIYYGDFKKYPIIGKFNKLKDVTKVRVGEVLKIPVIAGVSLLDLKQRQENYLNSRQTKSMASLNKSVQNIKTEPAGAKIKPNTDLKSTNTKSKLELNYQSENTQNTMTPPENKKVFELEKKDMQEAGKTFNASIKKPDLKEPAMEKTIEPKPETNIPSKKQTVKKMKEKVGCAAPYDRAIALFNKKKYSKAIPLFSAVEENKPEDKKLLDYLYKSYFQMGLLQFNSKAYLKASDSFKSALKYNKQCENCQSYMDKCLATYKEKHYNLGIQYFSREQLDKAIEEWNLVKKIDPDYKKVTPNLKKAELLFQRLKNIKQSNSQ